MVGLLSAFILSRNGASISGQTGVPVLIALEVLAFIFFAVVLIFALARPPEGQPSLGMRRRIFVMNALLLIALFAVAIVRFRFPVDESVPWLKAALHGIWFAMLGSVAISFKGVYDHTEPREWDEGWWLWYLGRPLTGAIVGAMTYLLLQVVNPNQPPSIPVLAVAAFVLGTQERRFFGYLYEVGKLVLTTPDSARGVLNVADITPNKGSQNEILLVTGSGFKPGATATLGGVDLTSTQVAPDGTALTGLIPAGAPGSVVALVIANPSGAAYQRLNAFTFA